MEVLNSIKYFENSHYCQQYCYHFKNCNEQHPVSQCHNQFHTILFFFCWTLQGKNLSTTMGNHETVQSWNSSFTVNLKFAMGLQRPQGLLHITAESTRRSHHHALVHNALQYTSINLWSPYQQHGDYTAHLRRNQSVCHPSILSFIHSFVHYNLQVFVKLFDNSTKLTWKSISHILLHYEDMNWLIYVPMYVSIYLCNLTHSSLLLVLWPSATIAYNVKPKKC